MKTFVIVLLVFALVLTVGNIVLRILGKKKK